MKDVLEFLGVLLAAIAVIIGIAMLVAVGWCLVGLLCAWVWNAVMPGYGFQETLWWHWSAGGFALNLLYQSIRGKSS